MKPLVVLAAAITAALALALVGVAAASERHPTLTELEGEVMCPTCKTPLDQSDSPAADRIRAFITRRIRAGDTKSEIKAKLEAQFGPTILAAPPREGFDLLAWWLPVAGFALGAGALAILAWRWTRAPREPAAVPSYAANGRGALPNELEQRVDEELARFEA